MLFIVMAVLVDQPVSLTLPQRGFGSNLNEFSTLCKSPRHGAVAACRASPALQHTRIIRMCSPPRSVVPLSSDKVPVNAARLPLQLKDDRQGVEDRASLVTLL